MPIDRVTSTEVSGNFITINAVVNYFLYGSLNAPDDLYDRIKPEEYIDSIRGNLTLNPNLPAVELNVDASTFLTSGAGRFALPSAAPIVQLFFRNSLAGVDLDPGEYSIGELREIVGGDPFGISTGTTFSIEHIFRTDGRGDFEEGERALIFGNSSFTIDGESSRDDPVFVVEIDAETGEEIRFIRNLGVSANDDNFDFSGGSLASDVFNAFFQDRIDPFRIGTQVEFDFDNSNNLIFSTYTREDFIRDQIEFASTSSGITTRNFDQIENALIQSGALLPEIEGFNVAYGTFEDNTIAIGISNFPDQEEPVLILGGEGEDTLGASLEGSRLYGHEDDDTLRGGRGDDKLFGGSGNDTITGADGDDRIYGDFSEENFNGAEEREDERVAGEDKLMGDDGDDELFGGEESDILEGGDGEDKLYGNNEENEEDDAADTLEGGANDDDYFVGNGDRIIDEASDRGSIDFLGLTLTGGVSEEEGGENEIVDGRTYTGEDDETYVLVRRHAVETF